MSRNLIVLIGNGFDIANGLKTSYSNFADYYLKNIICVELTKYSNGGSMENNLILSDFLENLTKDVDFYGFIIRKDVEGLFNYLKKDLVDFKSMLKNSFLAKLFADSYANWFDIENAYFKELVKYKNEAIDKIISDERFDIKKVEKLNKEFSEIRTALIEYLSTLEPTKKSEIENFFNINLKLEERDNVYAVNFNYTQVFSQYIDSVILQNKITLNHIHGELISDKSGNIIFGYGNDQNKDYKEMKNLEKDDFLEFFKTSEFIMNSQYTDLYNDALDVYSDYEVWVLGHSLGLTDKTLLSEVINSEKCKKIHLFKRKAHKENSGELTKSFKKLHYSAIRIMNDEKKSRIKITNFNEAVFFP